MGWLSVAVWQGCERGEQWAERRAAQSSHDLPFPSGQDVVAAASPTCVWPSHALTHMASLAFPHQILAQACGRATLLPHGLCQNLSRQVTCTRLALILQAHGVSLKAAATVVGSASPALGADTCKDLPLLLCFLGLVAGWGWWFWLCPLKHSDASA